MNTAHFEGHSESTAAFVQDSYSKVMVITLHCLKEYCALFKNTPSKGIATVIAPRSLKRPS
jgi:hypothetical protein